jgi:small-conductance mechanosensitive channel
LAAPSLWRREATPEPTAPARPRLDAWTAVRRIVVAATVAGVGASLIGYGHLGNFIVNRLLLTGIVAGALFLGRGLLHEVVALPLHSQFLRQRVGISLATLGRLRFWLRTAVDPLLFVLGVFLVVPLWGVPKEDLLSWTGQALTGFKIGSVTIALTDIALAILVFFAVMAATRMGQRALQERVLAETSFEPSVQQSLTAGLGYVGVIIAAALSIAVAGVDLTNVALVAGALSVGIGFGLQNVVNNFVSGLIILVERPVKVGDWVIVGEKEGLVKRISFRATELETWQRASVIIPNADIISSPVVNWTFADRLGRVEIKIGVAYGSDTAKVRDLLLECARRHRQVVAVPEPYVLFQDFGESSLGFELRCFTDNVFERPRIASDIRFDIDRRFREEGIEIPFPQQVVHTAPGELERSLAVAARTGHGLPG